jgi:hypothetical protein
VTYTYSDGRITATDLTSAASSAVTKTTMLHDKENNLYIGEGFFNPALGDINIGSDGSGRWFRQGKSVIFKGKKIFLQILPTPTFDHLKTGQTMTDQLKSKMLRSINEVMEDRRGNLLKTLIGNEQKQTTSQEGSETTPEGNGSQADASDIFNLRLD